MISGIAGGVGMLICVLLLLAGDRASKRRQAAFRNRYGSFEGFRKQVDAERIQDIRRTQGNVHAIKAVRQDHPHTSLVMAKRYVEKLPA